MNRDEWVARLQEAEWAGWKQYFEAADTLSDPASALNLLASVCEECHCQGQPSQLPPSYADLRCAVAKVHGPPVEAGMTTLRKLLTADAACAGIVPHLYSLPKLDQRTRNRFCS